MYNVERRERGVWWLIFIKLNIYTIQYMYIWVTYRNLPELKNNNLLRKQNNEHTLSWKKKNKHENQILP